MFKKIQTKWLVRYLRPSSFVCFYAELLVRSCKECFIIFLISVHTYSFVKQVIEPQIIMNDSDDENEEGLVIDPSEEEEEENIEDQAQQQQDRKVGVPFLDQV